jgi:LCP family protein required for cell wall assembly
MSLAPTPQAPPRPGLGLLKRFVLAGALIFLLAGVATATAALLEVKTVVDIIKTGHKIPGIDNVLDNVDGGGPQTILVLGSDHRYVDGSKDPVRSDTIMLIRLDPDNAATAVMSLPRDLEVTIPGRCGPCKINAAYAYGGPKLSVQVIKALFDFPINHVVNVNFGGFQRAVNRLGCVYVDVDRRYFHSNKGIPAGSGLRYSAIDIQPGYQKLCGRDSLAYVRYRHEDNDEVRAARQQSFMRQAKDQYGLATLFGSRDELLHIFARYTQTDVRSESAILRLLKLAFESSSHPIRTVHLNEAFSPDGSFVRISPGDLRAARDSFLKAEAIGTPQTRPASRTTTTSRSSKHGHRTSHRSSALAPGLVSATTQTEDYVADAATRTAFPLYYARARLALGSFASDPPRVYDVYDRAHHRYRAYRVVMSTGEVGQYYGIQGMSWTAPPILDSPTVTRTINGRKFDLFYDGSHLRLVAYRRPNAVYWVSNTLSETLTNRQMLGIAASLHRVGS